MQVKAGEQTELTSTAQQSAGEEQGSPRVGAVSLIPAVEVRVVGERMVGTGKIVKRKIILMIGIFIGIK